MGELQEILEIKESNDNQFKDNKHCNSEKAAGIRFHR